MKIHNLIIHNLVKPQFKEIADERVRDKEIVIGNDEEVFLNKLLTVYYKKSNPAYGVFDNDLLSYPLQSSIDRFVNGDITFVEQTKESFNLFKSKIKDEKNATGGYFIVVYFTSMESDYYGTIMLNNATSYNIDDDSLDIIKKLSLDLDKIDVGNLVNITRRKNGEPTYLSFTKGRKNISDYFLSFVGCTKISDSKHYSKKLKNGLNEYFKSENLSDNDKSALKTSVYSFLQEKTKKKQEVTIAELSNFIVPEEPEKFLEFISDEKFQVTSNFRIDLTTFKDYRLVHYRSTDISFEFSRKLLDNNIVILNENAKTLTITNIDQSVINQILQKDLEKDDEEDVNL